MFRIPRNRPWPPALDLSTVRETLLYMEDDARRVPGLERVAEALAVAIAEVEAAERSANASRQDIVGARFFPARLATSAQR